MSWAGISPWLLSLTSLKLFPASSLVLPLRTYGCGEPIQTAQLIATHFREKPVVLLSYGDPQTGHSASFVAQGDLKWWLLTGQSFEQILSGGMITAMILILVFSALIVVSASIAALRACWVAAQLSWRSKKTVFRKLQQRNHTCNFNSRMWLLRARNCEIAIVKLKDDEPPAKALCSPETGLSAAAILVLFECLEHAEWQIQKDAIMRLESRAARDVVRETLIKHAVGLPDTPAVSSRHDPMILPPKNFTRRDREIVKALGVLVRAKLEVVGEQVQNCCPAELVMKAVGAQWCQTTLKHRNPELFLAVALVFLTLGQKHIQGCFAALQPQQEGDWRVRAETARSLLNDVPSLFESVISALAEPLENDEVVRQSIREAFTSFWTAFDEFDRKLRLQETNVGLVFDAREPAESSSANASIAAMKTSLLQWCLQRCIAVLKTETWKFRRARPDTVTLLGTFAINQIKNLTAALQLTGNEAEERVARLNDVPSTFAFVISALADTLHDPDGHVIDIVHTTFEALWTAFNNFDETLRLQKTQFGQPLDSGEPAESSSATAAITALKCSLLQCCLQRCFSDLERERQVRCGTVQLLTNFAEKQIKNLSSALQIAWLESGKNVASLNDLQSVFKSLISTLADNQADRDVFVRHSIQIALGSFWMAFEEVEENLTETNFEQMSDCPSISFASPPVVSLQAVKDSLLKVCQQFCLTGFQASNHYVRREALAMLFKTNQALSKALERIQTTRVSSVLSWLESIVPSVAKMLGDKEATFRRALIDALSSCLSVLAKLSERCESVLLKVSNLEVCSDCPERADSQASASITTLKAALVQNCLKGCIVALKDKDWQTRLAAAAVIGNFAAGSVSSFSTAVQNPEMAAGLSNALSTGKAIVSELGKKHVEHGVEKAIGESWVRNGILDAGGCADSTHCGFGHPDSSSSSLDGLTAAKTFAALNAAVIQRCLQACFAALESKRWRIRQEAAMLLGTFAENQIKNPAVAPGTIGKEAPANMAKLDAPSRFESVIFALTDALGDENRHVRRSAHTAFESLWIAFDEKRLTLRADNVGQVSDVQDPADCSSAFASRRELTAAMFQCCLQRCFSQLKNEQFRVRGMVARLIGALARNQIKNLASALGTSPGKDPATTAKLNNLPSLFESLVSALAAALGDQNDFVRELVLENLESMWAAFEQFDERLEETNAPKILASPDGADSSSAIASLAQFKAAMFRCCLERCISALKNEQKLIRQDAALLLGTFAENQINNLASALKPVGKQAAVNMARLSAVPALLGPVLSVLAASAGDEDPGVRIDVRKAFESFWVAFTKVSRASAALVSADSSTASASLSQLQATILANYGRLLKADDLWTQVAGAELLGALPCKEVPIAQRSFVVFLIESSMPFLAESLSNDDLRGRGVEVSLSLWRTLQTLEGLGEDTVWSDNTHAGSNASLASSSGALKTQMVDSCLDSCVTLLNHDDRSVRLVAAAVLERFKNHSIKSLTLALRDPDRSMPVTAAEVEREITSFEDIVRILSPLVEDLNDMERHEKVNAIEAVGCLWTSLDEFDEHVMLKAIKVCGNSEGSKCIDSLQKMKTVVLEGSKVTDAHRSRLEFIQKLEILLEDLDSDVRLAAALELCKVGHPFAEAMVWEFLSKAKCPEEHVFAQSSRALAKSVASCKDSDRERRLHKAMTLFLGFIAADLVKVQKLGLEAVRIIGCQGLPLLMRTLERGSPEEQTAAAVGLWVVQKDFISTKLGCEPEASPDSFIFLQNDVEDLLYGKHPASLADSSTSLPVVQAGRDRNMKNWFVAYWEYSMGLVVDLPSPWTLVASAAAFVFFSSQHPLAELLSHPNTLVRSHHHRHWGFGMYGSWMLQKGLNRGILGRHMSGGFAAMQWLVRSPSNKC